MDNFLLLTVIGIGTFLLRASFIGILGDRGVPEALKRGLRFVPAAVLPALVVNPMLRSDNGIDLTNPRLLASVLALVVAARTRSILWTIVTGLAAQALFAALL